MKLAALGENRIGMLDTFTFGTRSLAIMKTYSEEIAELAGPLLDMAPRYAELLTKLTGTAWRADAPRNYFDPPTPPTLRTDFTLVREDTGATIHIALIRDHSHKKAHRVECSAGPVVLPDGTAHGERTPIRDFVPSRYDTNAGGRVYDYAVEAAVSYPRFLAEPDAVARRFVKHVADPLHKLWPAILERIATRTEQYNVRDQVVAELVERFGGRIGTNHGSGSTTYISFGAPYNLPSLTVDAGGAIRLTHTPTLTLATATALLSAIRETTEGKPGE
jgi:hypothetical protein